MNSIKIPDGNSSPISIRLETELLKDVDDIVIYMKTLGKNNVSRNSIIELMVRYVLENGSFDIDGEPVTCQVILNTFRAQNILNPEWLPKAIDD